MASFKHHTFDYKKQKETTITSWEEFNVGNFVWTEISFQFLCSDYKEFTASKKRFTCLNINQWKRFSPF
jgi:hypothetical protein